jgi:hypothetical protein
MKRGFLVVHSRARGPSCPMRLGHARTTCCGSCIPHVQNIPLGCKTLAFSCLAINVGIFMSFRHINGAFLLVSEYVMMNFQL